MRISDSQLLNLLKLNSYENFSKLLTELKVGDIFKGRIMDITQNKVILKTANGMQLEAKLSSEVELKIGQQLDFKVQSTNNNQIIIKPMIESSEKPNVIMNALSSAGLPLTDENVELVKGLIANQLPIDKDYVASLTQLLKNNDTTPQSLLFMIKNNLNINDKNLQQLNNFINNTNNLSEQLNELISDLVSSIDSDEGNQLLNTFINGVDKEIIEQSINKYILKEPQENTLKDINIVEKQIKLPSEKILFKDIDKTLEDLKIPEENRQIIKEEVIKNLLIKEFFIKLNDNEALAKVDEFYNKLSEKLDEAEKLFQYESNKAASSSNQSVLSEKISERIQNITSNIDFLNNLNENMTLVHIPLQFSNSLSGGNLFLVEDKEGEGKSSTNGMKTALLSLDLAYLGHLEAYIGLMDKKISMKIGVENEHLKTLFQKHILMLNEKLSEHGYNIEGISVNLLQNKYNFTETNDTKTIEEKRYSFDMRA